MRLSLRFILPLALVLGLFAYAIVPLVDGLTLRWFIRDLDMRGALLANTMQESLEEDLRSSSRSKVITYFNEVTRDERVYAIGFCEPNQAGMIATRAFPKAVTCADLVRFAAPDRHVLASAQGALHVSVQPIIGDAGPLGNLVIVHDMSFIQRRSEETKAYLFSFFIVLAAVVSLITVVVAQLSWRGFVQGTRALLRGEGLLRPTERTRHPELRPIAKDLRELMREVRAEVQLHDEAQVAWTPLILRQILRNDLRGDDVVVVSNREPYIHIRNEKQIVVQRPASGLVTALEPVMRACSGTWVAHGSGSADRETVDRHDRVPVPPEHAAYRLRRVWLAPEEEAGYYNGLANEGLWPLCHIAHVRPIFRSADWDHYVAVNRRFARAAADEAKSSNPVILVQDYHLALVPRMLREQLPDATIITFWHIPWPNPEAFAICPWRAEILDGLLGSSILGFHTQFHRNNFVDTVDRILEARVDRETFVVSYGGSPTAVKRYPISIEWPPAAEAVATPVEDCREEVRRRNGLPPDQLLGIGVDRLDYTKGILERFRAVERLFELHPQWIGKFSFLQIAAPSRSSIPQYQSFEAEVRALAGRINDRFGAGAPAIILKVEHHEARQVYEHYRAGDLCYVSSLHDGMNLVAKEFVSSRDDERGVLVLSQFTGASRELPEALVVNPYDIDECARALHRALAMPPAEQRDRMRLMRGLVQEFNVYRWAGRMLLDAAGMRARRRLPGAPRAVVMPLRSEGRRLAAL